MCPPPLGPFQPRHRIKRDPHGAHQGDVCRRRWNDPLHDKRNDRRDGEAQHHDMKPAPSARPPCARILFHGISVSHGHQIRRGAHRRSYLVASLAVAAEAAIPAAAIARAARSTQPPRALQEQSTWPKNKDSCSYNRRSHWSQNRPGQFRRRTPPPVLHILHQSATALRRVAARNDTKCPRMTH